MPKPIVAILRIGKTGNIANLSAALEYVGAQVEVIATATGKFRADHMVLPGVGAFFLPSEQLIFLRDEIKHHIRTRPALGICLGMQVLADQGCEFASGEGMGLIGGTSARLPVKSAPLPHLGWSRLTNECPSEIFEGIADDAEFYFMHSNAIEHCNCATSSAVYAGHRFVASVQRDNLYGVQFHPERSREAGLMLLQNFIRL